MSLAIPILKVIYEIVAGITQLLKLITQSWCQIYTYIYYIHSHYTCAPGIVTTQLQST